MTTSAPTNDSSKRTASSARPLHSHVHDAASVVVDRFHGVVAALPGLRNGWDSLVKVAFAPCAVGGVLREDLHPRQAAPPAPRPLEQRTARARAQLKQLGARHRLASGLPGGGLADVARPVSPQEAATPHNQRTTPDLVDFDDGISAISAHTLEEMVRRSQPRQETEVRLNPRDFTPVVNEHADARGGDRSLVGEGVLSQGTKESTEASFGAPRYDAALFPNIRTKCSPTETRHLQFSASPAADLHQVSSAKTQRTLHTTLTEETHEFETLVQRQEALYWQDAERVAHAEGHAWRPGRGGPSIEERARRLRELSRSRSRSDGTSGSHKSGSSLLSGPHPHDTFPLLTTTRSARSRKSAPQRQDAFVPGSRVAARSPDYGEI